LKTIDNHQAGGAPAMMIAITKITFF